MRLGEVARKALAFGAAASIFWLDVFPAARHELRYWKTRAEAIPDLTLRRDALFTHATKSRHAEGLAAFAVLATPTHRREVVRAAVAFEGILDYLDTVSEQPAEDPLANGLQLHRAFDFAVDLSAGSADYYALHSSHDDGGYLDALAGACRDALESFPSYPVCREALRRCVRFSGQAQSLNHAIPYGLDEEKVVAWAGETAAEIQLDREVKWWEIVSAGSSSLAVGALMAAAANPATTPAQVARIEATYFPWAGALSSLLDCLVDLGSDQVIANHLNRYSSREEAAEHLAAIASRSVELASELPKPELHKMIVAGMGGYYLAQPTCWAPGSDGMARSALEALGEFARPAVVVHCIRQGRARAALNAARGLDPVALPVRNIDV